MLGGLADSNDSDTKRGSRFCRNGFAAVIREQQNGYGDTASGEKNAI